jgi:hypothetical protein
MTKRRDDLYRIVVYSPKTNALILYTALPQEADFAAVVEDSKGIKFVPKSYSHLLNVLLQNDCEIVGDLNE